MTVAHVAECVGHLGQLVALLHDRLQLPRLEQLAEKIEVGPVEVGHEESGGPTAELCPQPHRGNVAERPDQRVPFPSDDDEPGVGGEHASALSPRLAPGDIEHQVVAPAALREVVAAVVDHVIRAERPRLLDVPRAANSRHFSSERLGDLDGERADAAGSAVDEDTLSRLKSAAVAQPLEGRQSGDRKGGRVLEGHLCRLEGGCLLDAGVLRKRSVRDPEDVIPRLEVGDVLADRLHRAGEVDADRRGLRPAQAGDGTRDPGSARDVVPVDAVHRRRADSHQHAVGPRLRPRDLVDPKHVRQAVLISSNSPHLRRKLYVQRKLCQ